MTTESIIAALNAIHDVRFQCGSLPTKDHGEYIHAAYRLCQQSTFTLKPEHFIEHGLPLNAIAEAVRVGVLRVRCKA